MSNAPPITRLGAVAVAAAALWTTIALYTVDASRQENALRLPGPALADVQRIAPQGWSFFTRDPREADFDVMAHDGTRWSSLFRGPNFAAENWFGWGRGHRAQGLEFGVIASHLDIDDSRECQGDLETCADGLAVARVVVNESPRATLCGDVLVVQRVPVPWAWLDAKHPVTMPAQVQRVRIEC